MCARACAYVFEREKKTRIERTCLSSQGTDLFLVSVNPIQINIAADNLRRSTFYNRFFILLLFIV